MAVTYIEIDEKKMMQAMKDKKMSQLAVATESGVDASCVCKYLKGEMKATKASAMAICMALGISLKDIEKQAPKPVQSPVGQMLDNKEMMNSISLLQGTVEALIADMTKLASVVLDIQR